MLTRPDRLSDEVLTQALGAGWDITPAAIGYLAVGYGSHHWRVTAGHGQRWFVTVDDLADRLRSAADTMDAACDRLRSALETARALADTGLSFVVAPISTVDGGILRRIGGAYAMAVYPFVAGRVREFGDALSTSDRHAVLPLITAVHNAPASVRRHARRDDFLLPSGDVLWRALSELAVRRDGGPYGERARRLLARQAVSHWMLVDWDTTLVAPPERDLWVIGAANGSVTDAYHRATGREISSAMLDLYQLTWELSDVASSVTRFRREHGDTAEDRADWEILSRLARDPPAWASGRRRV